MRNRISLRYLLFALFLFSLVMPGLLFGQAKKLTFEDIMKWKDISDPAISANGEWLIYSLWPDRGDGEVRVRSIDAKTMYTIERGDNPSITPNGEWAGAYIKPPFAEELKAKKDDKPKQGYGLLNTSTGQTFKEDSVQSAAFSNDGKWVALRHYQSAKIAKKYKKNKELGTALVLRNLSSGSERTLPFVSSVSFDSTSTYMAYTVVDTSGDHNGLYIQPLNNSGAGVLKVEQQQNGLYNNLSWDNGSKRLAYTQSKLDDHYKAGEADIKVWDPAKKQSRTLVASGEVRGEWMLHDTNRLRWTKDGKRLFFGLVDRSLIQAGEEAEKDSTKAVNVYDQEEILQKKGLDVWHWNDALIKPHEKKTWKRRQHHLYLAVYHFDNKKWVQLADKTVPDVEISQNENYTMGRSNVPYLKLITWLGSYSDYYVVDLKNGQKTKVVERLSTGADISPQGKFVVYFKDKNWHLYNVKEKTYRNLTKDMDVPFYNEDHDYPSPVPSYWLEGWTKDDKAVLLNDKYDIWKFATSGGKGQNITTDGRKRELTYRIKRLNNNRQWFGPDEEVVLEAYYQKKKTYGLYTMQLNRTGARKRLEAPKKFQIVTKAKSNPRIIYTRESYDEYPNLWVSEGMNFEKVRQISQQHMNLHEKYNWGHAELIDWLSLDGKYIQGAVIKPDNYVKGKKYPVLVYYYRFFSQRAYEFNNITNDDRPTLPQWVSDDYVVFLPDIRFRVGTPGFASTKSLVPGVLKLIEMGIADPHKIGLHGHSWSGYQTAFMITQTDIFAAAIAGAPVGNMTSAYSGIRWGSGLARQFQYEQTQSRIGGSLWEYPERYIENSPVFFADRITTPLLIMAGDEDTAVPWYQSIEMYLAMRRLKKDAIFLQYHGEPHHLQRYSNRLDYAIKMKQYFDHYLRGEPAADWIKEGVPYRGK